MSRNDVFYIGRIIKINFSKEDFIRALLDPKPYEENDNHWTLTDIHHHNIEDTNFIYGKLTKSMKLGMVSVLTDDLDKEIEKEEPNLIDCSSEFVYLPKYSGIAFRSIPGRIEPKRFIKKFNQIIFDSLGGLLVECDIKLIDDLETFNKRLLEFDSFSTIKTKVNPPNPLYGRFWKPLKEYLIKRKTDELSLKESSKNDALRTKIKELIRLLLHGNEEEIEKYITDNEIDIVDASILMSIDGYGESRIDGKKGNERIFIKTHEKALSIITILTPT